MVTLKQLVGKRREGDRVATISQPIDGVYLDGQHVGWIDRMSGAQLSFIRNLPDAMYHDVHSQVCNLREEAGEFGPPSPKFHAVAYVPPEVMERAMADAGLSEVDEEDDSDE